MRFWQTRFTSGHSGQSDVITGIFFLYCSYEGLSGKWSLSDTSDTVYDPGPDFLSRTPPRVPHIKGVGMGSKESGWNPDKGEKNGTFWDI